MEDEKEGRSYKVTHLIPCMKIYFTFSAWNNTFHSLEFSIPLLLLFFEAMTVIISVLHL